MPSHASVLDSSLPASIRLIRVIRGFFACLPSSLRLCPLGVFALISIAIGATSVGCSSSKIAPVSGRITLDGKPLAGVHIGFQPIAKPGDINPGSGSYAITDSDGLYTLLQVHGEQPGATIGQHRVEITAKSDYAANIDPVKRPPPKVFVPAKYSQTVTSRSKFPGAAPQPPISTSNRSELL